MRLRVFTEPQQGASYDQQVRVAQLAEQLGFDAFFRSDHFLAMGDTDGLPGPTDAWITLAGIARETSRIRLGTLMTSATFRLPGLLAVAVAEVDAMSQGRVELGLGSGWFDGEHTAYGIPFPPLGERFERLEEQLAIITGMWACPPGDRFSFHGDHYQLEDCPALPKPVQRPGPPVLIGGHGPKHTPRLAATYGAEVNVPFGSEEDTATQFRRSKAVCESIGRDPGSLVCSAAQVVCCGRDEAELARRAAAIGRSVDELRQNGLCGTPDEVLEKLARFVNLGADRMYLQFLTLDDLEHLELIGQEVLPAAARLG
ncbi:MAG TPA: LLM class F420-dependent oxidoreductase [Acidimicrobiales bacterium]|nr:LLM class F420-dependent oxidoreductase [Acidimicrobiales bacterium]